MPERQNSVEAKGIFHQTITSPHAEPGTMSNPYAASQQTALNTGAPQNVEAYALIELARRMAAAQAEPVDRDAVLHVVRTNWKLWTIIQASLVDPDCAVPTAIRENLLSLSNFVDRRSAELLSNPDASALTTLININRQIGAGLLGNPGEGMASQAADDTTSPTHAPSPIARSGTDTSV